MVCVAGRDERRRWKVGALQIMEELVYHADELGFILQEIRSFRILNKVT